MAYATAADLATWVGTSQTLPDEQEQGRLLDRASGVVDGLLVASIYTVDDDGNPTDTDVAAALADATCAQVEWWLESGDELEASSQWDQVSIGSVRLGRGGSSGADGGPGPSSVAPRAVAELHRAGLLPGSVAT